MGIKIVKVEYIINTFSKEEAETLLASIQNKSIDQLREFMTMFRKSIIGTSYPQKECQENRTWLYNQVGNLIYKKEDEKYLKNNMNK